MACSHNVLAVFGRDRTQVELQSASFACRLLAQDSEAMGLLSLHEALLGMPRQATKWCLDQGTCAEYSSFLGRRLRHAHLHDDHHPVRHQHRHHQHRHHRHHRGPSQHLSPMRRHRRHSRPPSHTRRHSHSPRHTRRHSARRHAHVRKHSLRRLPKLTEAGFLQPRARHMATPRASKIAATTRRRSWN